MTSAPVLAPSAQAAIGFRPACAMSAALPCHFAPDCEMPLCSSSLISDSAAETPCQRSIDANDAEAPGPEWMRSYSSLWLKPCQR
jgi:hypothetical protein